MIKHVLLGTLLMSGFSFGQVTVDQYDLVEPSDIVEQAYDQSSSINHTASGTDLTWNYAALLEDSSGVFNFGAAGWADGSSNFPDANLSGDDNSGMGNLFLRKTASSLDLLGFYGDIMQSGNNEAYYFDPQSRITPLPLTYNTTDQNSYVFEFTFDPGQQADSIRVKQNVEQDFNADAWGELTTPLGTYEVIRLLKTEITTDSTWAYAFGTSQLVDSGKDTSYTYSFWTNDQNAGFPLVEYEYNPSTQQIEGDITWLKLEPTSSIEENEAASFEVYPNPANENINISINDSKGKYLIFDITGKEVLSGKTTNEGSEVNISDLKSGVYVVRVFTNNGQVGTKRFVKK